MAPSLMKAAIVESGTGNLLPYGTSFQQFGAQFAQKSGCAVTDVCTNLFRWVVVVLANIA